MTGVTVDGRPWGEHRPWGPGTPTHDELNLYALTPASRQVGYCLCLHPFSNVINFDGMRCRWCGEQQTPQSSSAEAKSLRTQAILAAFPELAKEES